MSAAGAKRSSQLLTLLGVLLVVWETARVFVDRMQPEADLLTARQYWAAVPAFVCVLGAVAWRALLSQIEPGRKRLRASAIGLAGLIVLFVLQAVASQIWGTGSGFVPARVVLDILLVTLAPVVHDAVARRAANRGPR